jgi:serine/alanine adding enzyme
MAASLSATIPPNAPANTDRPSVSIATEADAAAWEAYVSEHPGSSGYHAWAWRRVFDRAFGHESIYLLARRAEGSEREGFSRASDGQCGEVSPVQNIRGVLPLVQINSLIFGRTLTSLPFLNYGGVVSDSDTEATALVDAAAELARERRCRYVELRHSARRFPQLACKQHKVAMLLRLDNLHRGLWDALDRKVRNQIRKAQKSGLTSIAGPLGDADLLDDFYTVFARNMRDLGTPVYARRFFEEVLRAFPDRARLHVVRLGSAPIAAGLTYRTHTRVEVPWASSIRDHNALCPNHLLYWNILESAITEGADLFDFGRSTANEGTFHFKRQWGAEPLPLFWEYCLVGQSDLPDQSPKNPKFRSAVELWKRCPLWLANLVGPYIVRSIP